MRGNPGLLGPLSPYFVGYALFGGATVTWPTGTTAGCTALIFSNGGSFTSGGAGWSTVAAPGITGGSFFLKSKLTATDISTPPVLGVSSYSQYVMVFNFANAISLVSTITLGTAAVTTRNSSGGFTKPANCLGLIFVMADAGTPAGVMSITSPTMNLTYQGASANLGGQAKLRIAHDLSPSEYTSGGAIALTGFNTDSTNSTALAVLALT